MKTPGKQTIEKSNAAMQPSISAVAGMIFILIFFLSANSFQASAQKVQINVNIELPAWAPYYENVSQVRYYYLPDIECFYDVRTREFIFMEDGHWLFTRSLPPAYRWFNLNNCFLVALDAHVAMPWRHFHYYVAHYPRYYYRTVYRDHYHRNYPLRGFDENGRHEVYNHRGDRENYQIYRKNDARNDSYNPNGNRNDYPDNRVGPSQSSEPVNYYGKKVGKPVKVQKNMRSYEDKGEKHEKQDNKGKGQGKK